LASSEVIAREMIEPSFSINATYESHRETGAAFFPVHGAPQATRIATDKTDDSDVHAGQ
jgi:hypothetical protein